MKAQENTRKCEACGEAMMQARENKRFCSNSCRGKFHRRQLAEREKEKEVELRLLEKLRPQSNEESQESSSLAGSQNHIIDPIEIEITECQNNILAYQAELASIPALKIAEEAKTKEEAEKIGKELLRLNTARKLSYVDFYNKYLNTELKELIEWSKSGNASVDAMDLIYPNKLRQVYVRQMPPGSPLWFITHEAFNKLDLQIKQAREKAEKLKSQKYSISVFAKEFALNRDISESKKKIETLRQQQINNKIEAEKQKQAALQVPPETQRQVDDPRRRQTHHAATTNHHFGQPISSKPTKPKTPKGEIGGADLLNQETETFVLDGPIGAFMGRMDRKMAAIGLTGDSGSGKSTFSLSMAKLFAAHGFTVKYFSLEEGLGSSMKRKIQAAQIGNDIKFAETGSLYAIRQDAKRFDVVFIDSFTILDTKQDDLEKLRKDFPTTIFVCIHQKTTGGTIRGGSKIFYNSTAIINIEIDHDQGRLAVMKKSRYGTEGAMYNITYEELKRAGDW